MVAQLDPVRFAQALVELGITPDAIRQVRSAPQAQGERLLDELKSSAKSRYRRLAFELHPDRTGNDEVKAAKFSFLTMVVKEVEGMRWVPFPPPPPQQTIRIQFVFPVPVQVVPAPAVVPQGAARGIPRGIPRGSHVVFMRPR